MDRDDDDENISARWAVSTRKEAEERKEKNTRNVEKY